MNHHERLDSGGEGEGEEDEQFSNFKDRGCVSRSTSLESHLAVLQKLFSYQFFHDSFSIKLGQHPD